MNINTQPDKVYKEYDKVLSFKTALDLFETVKKNQNFYLGKQWEGVVAPNIEKPVINILRQGIDYYVSNTVSDDISVQVVIPDELSDDVKEALQYVASTEIERVFEQIKFKSKQREFIKNCATDGDACNYFWFDTSYKTARNPDGNINLELIDNTNIGFGDPTEQDEQKQPFIIIVQKLPLDTVKDMASKNKKDPEAVKADAEAVDQQETFAQMQGDYVTLITKLWKEDGTVHAVQVTKDIVIKDPIDLKQRLYPVSYMSWRKTRNCYHGESPLTSVIPNQIMVNKAYMMQNEFLKKSAFPKLLFDKTKIKDWTNKVEAIGVDGNPNEAVFSSSPTVQMNPQSMAYIQDLIDKTKESMGIYDVALGNARPENTSAIIALQKTAQQPLELQKMDYYQMIENSVRIILDIMSAYYGKREVTIEHTLTPQEIQDQKDQRELLLMQQQQQAQAQMLPTPMDPNNPQMMQMQPPVAPTAPQVTTDEATSVMLTIPFDYADIAPDKLELVIEVGGSAYWSEILQIQTLDNMYNKQIIPDALTYLEQMPEGILRSKKDIIEAIKKKQAKDAQMQQEMMANQQMQTIPQV